MISTFDSKNFIAYCNKLAASDDDLDNILQQHGYSPMWNRKPSFETLVHIILEQQVSLASAKAALDKLRQKIGTVAPGNLLKLTDKEMRACYFSRQKTVYARHLAEAVLSKSISIKKLSRMADEEVKASLKSIKGIGDWTADVFLMMSLRRTDCFPPGDVALIKSIRKVKNLEDSCSKEKVLAAAQQWRPYRTIAAYLLWHSYLSDAGKKISSFPYPSG